MQIFLCPKDHNIYMNSSGYYGISYFKILYNFNKIVMILLDSKWFVELKWKFIKDILNIITNTQPLLLLLEVIILRMYL